jgi:carboxymethylenebutenolidase
MPGDYIKIKTKDNQEFSGFLCLPPGGKGPGLLLVQEIFGVNSHIRDVAELYAAEGFVVLAPDLFWRSQPGFEIGYDKEDFAKGIEQYGKLNMNQALDDLSDAIDTLHGLSSVTGKVGVVGFCLGGHIAYRLAARGKVDAAVSYYGGGIDQALDEAKNIRCPMIMHFGGLDTHISPVTVEKIQAALAGKNDVTIYNYADADHGFNCDQRKTYNRKAAMLAYSRSAAFLHKNLDAVTKSVQPVR